MWQILNPNSWVKPSVNVFGTFSESPGFIDSAVTGNRGDPQLLHALILMSPLG